LLTNAKEWLPLFLLVSLWGLVISFASSWGSAQWIFSQNKKTREVGDNLAGKQQMQHSLVGKNTRLCSCYGKKEKYNSAFLSTWSTNSCKISSELENWRRCGLSHMYFSRHGAWFHICLSIQCTLLAVGGGLGAFEEAKHIHAYISNRTATAWIKWQCGLVAASLTDMPLSIHTEVWKCDLWSDQTNKSICWKITLILGHVYQAIGIVLKN
jgi:hypothetical protein